MKAPVKQKRAPKRDLFAELSEGMKALAQSRDGKRTLRTHTVEIKPAPEVSPKELVRVRESLNLSQALFADVYVFTPAWSTGVFGWEMFSTARCH